MCSFPDKGYGTRTNSQDLDMFRKVLDPAADALLLAQCDVLVGKFSSALLSKCILTRDDERVGLEPLDNSVAGGGERFRARLARRAVVRRCGRACRA